MPEDDGSTDTDDSDKKDEKARKDRDEKAKKESAGNLTREQQAYIESLSPAQVLQLFKQNPIPSAQALEGLNFEGEHGKQLAELPVNWNPIAEVPTDETAQGIVAPAGSTTTTAPAKAKPTTPSTADAADQMMQALANEFTSETQALAPYVSGQAGADATGYATEVGRSIGGPGVEAQNPAYAAALAGPQQNVANAAEAGAKGITGAVENLGTANAAYLQTAPYQGLMSALQSEAQYKTETGTAIPQFTGSSLPPWMEAAYQATVGAAAPGTTTVGTTRTRATPPPPRRPTRPRAREQPAGAASP